LGLKPLNAFILRSHVITTRQKAITARKLIDKKSILYPKTFLILTARLKLIIEAVKLMVKDKITKR